MSLVVQVSQTNQDGRTHTFPFEADPSYYFEFADELIEFRDKGKGVLGKRLWLGPPMTPSFYGLTPAGPALGVPNLVRVITGSKTWVLYPNYGLRIVPWTDSRIVRFED